MIFISTCCIRQFCNHITKLYLFHILFFQIMQNAAECEKMQFGYASNRQFKSLMGYKGF